MTMMLKNVVENGTAKQIQLKNTLDCAGKTGTTQNNYDRWYIGYTPYYIGGVWYGYEYPQPLSGGNVCIDVWDNVMEKIHKRKGIVQENAKHFSESENIVVAEYCLDSGKLVTEACLSDPRGDRRETGYFAKGSEPSALCDCHVPVLYDTVSGGVVPDGMCPAENLKTVGLIQVKRSFPIQVYVTDAQYVWYALPKDVLPETSPTLPFFYNLLKEEEFCGISRVEAQYNRLCRTHFNYFEWKEKQKEDSA